MQSRGHEQLIDAHLAPGKKIARSAHSAAGDQTQFGKP